MQNVIAVAADHVDTCVYTEQWEEEPETIGEPNEECNFKEGLPNIAFVEEEGQKVDTRAVELLVEFHDAHDTQCEWCEDLGPQRGMMSQGNIQQHRWNDCRPAITHIHKEPEA